MQASARHFDRRGSIRLWIDPPYKDETISSFLDRAAGFYRIDRMDLVKQIDPEFKRWNAYLPDFDGHMGERSGPKLFKTLGWHEELEPINFTVIPSECLKPSARFAYCPLCFKTDLEVGRTPYFRWQWAIPYLTLCHEHSAPLFVWEKARSHQRVLPWDWYADPKPEHADKCPWFAQHLKIAEQGLLELQDSKSALSLVHRLQMRTLALDKGPTASYRNYDYSDWVALNLAVEKGAAWPDDGLPPLASQMRPASSVEGLFAEVPETDWKRLKRSTLRGFRQQKSVTWRRTVLWFSGASILGCFDSSR